MGKMDKFRKNGSTNLATDLLQQMDVVLNAELPEGKNKVVQIDIGKIRPNPNNDYNISDTTEGILSLAEDIERNGLLHNLVVSKRSNEDYVLLSGERRYRALSYLLAQETEKGGDAGKYRSVSCRVVEGLSERQEMIMLDAANLQTRGGAGDEVFARKAIIRYRDNVKDEYGLSDTDARRLLEEVTALSKTSINENIRIEENLNSELLQMLDNNEITKRNARSFVKMTQEQQISVSKALSALKDVFEDYPEKYKVESEKALNGFMAAAEEPTDKRIELKIADVYGNIKSAIYKHKSETEPANSKMDFSDRLKQAKETQKQEKAESQRDIYLKKCNKILRSIEELSGTKTVARIKEFDAATEEDHKKVLLKINEIIEMAQALQKQITGE